MKSPVEWPFEKEYRTVALLEKIKSIMADIEADPGRPKPWLRRPKTARDVAANLRTFSDEARQSPEPAGLRKARSNCPLSHRCLSVTGG